MDEFKISCFLSPARICKWRWKLWRSQYYPPARLRKLQWRLLARQLDHCFRNVPYYRDLAAGQGLKREDFTRVEDLRKLPILNKEIVREHNDEFKADGFAGYRPVRHHSSGTTCKPLYLYWDMNSYAIELVAVWRIFSWSGYRLGVPFIDIRRQELKGHRWNWKCRGLEISADYVDTDMGGEYAQLLRRRGVKLWRGCPTGIILLIEALKKAGADDVKPGHVYSISENLSDDERELITAWTGGPVHDHYSHQEHVACIAQCADGGYHISSEYGVVEVLRADGTPAEPGEEGRIVGTGLHERSFPLLRYDSGDYAIQSDRLCPCGRTLPLLEKFTGRSRCGCS